MCEHCGCSGEPVEDKSHGHTHGTQHHHHHDHEDRTTLTLSQSILSKNDRLAERNRGFFGAKGISVVNLVSSPGSGKTALLERTLADLAGRFKMAVIVGDLATENDARRLRRHGVPAVQITTGHVCHLDAHMVQHAMDDLDLGQVALLFIENVGNLVCPASFDLGEDRRIVVTSVTEGEDKPLKYPVIFRRAHCVLLNKMDLAAAVEFRREQALANLREAAPDACILEVSARTGQGLAEWYAYLEHLVRAKQKARA